MQSVAVCKGALLVRSLANATCLNKQSPCSAQLKSQKLICSLPSARLELTSRHVIRQKVLPRAAAQQGEVAGGDVEALEERLASRIKEIQQERKDGSFLGGIPDDVNKLVDELEEIAEREGQKLTADAVNGVFRGFSNSTNYLDEDSCTTVGTLTFQQFGPKDLKIHISETEVRQGVDSPSQYHTLAYFTAVEGELKGLEGIQTALGEYDLESDKPIRQNVYFTGIRIEPKDKGTASVAKWLDAMKDANPMMGEDGVAEIMFPQKIKAFRDFIVPGQRLQVTRGNRKSLVIVKGK